MPSGWEVFWRNSRPIRFEMPSAREAIRPAISRHLPQWSFRESRSLSNCSSSAEELFLKETGNSPPPARRFGLQPYGDDATSFRSRLVLEAVWCVCGGLLASGQFYGLRKD